MFGGANHEGPLNDLYEFDEESFTWNFISTTGLCPPLLEMHSGHLWNDKGKLKLLVFGGRTYDKVDPENTLRFVNEIYCLDLETRIWSILGSFPVPIGSHAATLVVNRYLVTYGGTNGMKFFDTIMRFDLETKSCLMYTNSKHAVSDFFKMGRLASTIENALDEIVVLFGGCNLEKDCNDVLVIKVEDLINDQHF